MHKIISNVARMGAKLLGCLTVASVVMAFSTNVFAGEDCKIERIISDNGAVTLTESGLLRDEVVYLWVVPGDTSWADANANEGILNTAVFVGAAEGVISGMDRVAEFDFIIPTNGKYTALCRGKKRTIVYADKTMAIAKVSELKNLAQAAVCGFIDNNKETLTVSTDLHSAGNTQAADMVFAYLSSNPNVSVNDIGAIIDKAYLITAINNGTVTDIGQYLYSSGIADKYDYDASDNAKIINKVKGASGIADFDAKLATVYVPSVEPNFGVEPGSPSYTGGNPGGGGGGGVSGGYISKTNEKADGAVIDISGYAPVQNGGNKVMYFNDMEGFEWAEEAVNHLYVRGIVSGTTKDTYCPEQNVKREEFAKLLIEMTKLNVVDEDKDFTDVPKDAWFYDSVNRAYKAGIIKGMSDTIFGAGMNISREDMAVMIYNTLYVCGAELPENAVAGFADAASISDYADDAVASLVKLGVLSGYSDGTFKPQATATRAEAAQVVYKTLTLLSK